MRTRKRPKLPANAKDKESKMKKKIRSVAMASAKTKTVGGALAGAVTVSKGVKMFQLNDGGAIVGVSLTGAKYYKDKEFN